jgi:hypothetical protein
MTMDRERYEAEICGRLHEAVAVPFKAVPPDSERPQIAHCHENVDAWVAMHPGSVAVRGWVIYARCGPILMLTAHSVVQGSNGELFDITPLGDESVRDGLRFIRHIGSDRAFFEEKERGINIQCACTESVTG